MMLLCVIFSAFRSRVGVQNINHHIFDIFNIHYISNFNFGMKFDTFVAILDFTMTAHSDIAKPFKAHTSN